MKRPGNGNGGEATFEAGLLTVCKGGKVRDDRELFELLLFFGRMEKMVLGVTARDRGIARAVAECRSISAAARILAPASAGSYKGYISQRAGKVASVMRILLREIAPLFTEHQGVTRGKQAQI